MRWNLWLAQPETERSLSAFLRITLGVVVLWIVVAAYGVWSTHNTLVAVQKSVTTDSKKITQLTQALPEKRSEARKAAEVQVVSTQGAGSAEITVELAELASVVGAQTRGVRIGDGDQKAAATTAAPEAAQSAAKPTSQAPTPAKSADATQEAFECNVSGEYASLTGFLHGLAASRHVLDITSIEVTQTDAKPMAGSPRLEMKLNGTIDEAPGK